MKRHWSKEFGPAYFVTNTIVEWKNIFIFKPYITIIRESWKHFKNNRDVLFYAFVVMPNHLHYIVQPTNANYNIVDMQRDFKKFTSKRILAGLNYELQNGMFSVLHVFKSSRLEREPAEHLLDLFRRVGKYNNQTHKVWMSDEKPEAIHSDEFMAQKINYIHWNPVKTGLVSEPQDYPYSSARNHYLEEDLFFSVTGVY